MRYTYDDELAVTLTVSDWLHINVALNEARRWNEQNGYPNCAKDLEKVKQRLGVFTSGPMEQAALDTQDKLGKLSALRVVS